MRAGASPPPSGRAEDGRSAGSSAFARRHDESVPGCVLVVEDEEGVRLVERLALRAKGWDVLEAADGTKALELLRTNHVDVMVLDLSLPDVDGWSVLDFAVTHGGPPVVVCSALTVQLDVARRCWAAGAAAVADKFRIVESLPDEVRRAASVAA